MDEELKQEPINENNSNTVVVNKNALDKMMAKMSEIENQNKMLLEIADKGRLSHWEATHKGINPQIVRLSTYDNKIITSWNMEENKVWKDPQGKWQEKQEIKLIFDNGEKKLLPYSEFVANTAKIEVNVVSTTQKGNQTFFEVETKDKKKIIVDSTFVN